MPLAVANQQEAGVIRHLPPFVKIQRNRIRLLDSGKPRRQHGRKNPERAKRAIDMKPEIFVAAQRRETGEIVDRADIDGAGGSHHQKGLQPVGAIAENLRAQRGQVDTVRLIDRDAAQRIAAETRDVHRLGDAAVRGLGRVGGQPRAGFANAALPHVRSKHGPARHQNRHQIGHRRPGDKDAAGSGRKAEHLARPFDDLALDLDRHMVAPAAIGIQPGRQHLGKHADCRAAAMHPAHEAGMKIADRIGRDEIAAERSILRRAATLTVQLELMETKFARAGDASPDELDLYSRTASNMRRLLEAVGIRRRPREVLSLSEYLRRTEDDADDGDVTDAEIVIDGDTTTSPERRMGDRGCEPEGPLDSDDRDRDDDG